MSAYDDNISDSVEAPRRSSRKMSKTEKGNAYELEILSGHVKKLTKRIYKAIDSLHESTRERCIEQSRNDTQLLDQLLNELGEISGRLKSLRDSDSLLELLNEAEVAAMTTKLEALQIDSDKKDTGKPSPDKASLHGESNAYELEIFSNRVKKLSKDVQQTIDSLNKSTSRKKSEQFWKDSVHLDQLLNEIGQLSICLNHVKSSEPLVEMLNDVKVAAMTAKVKVLHIHSDTKKLVKHPLSLPEASPEIPIHDKAYSEVPAGKASLYGDVNKLEISSQRNTVLSFSNRLTKQITLLEHTLMADDADLVKRETANLDICMADLVEANGMLIDVLDKKETPLQLKWMEGMDNRVFGIKEKSCSWLVAHNKQESEVASDYESEKRRNLCKYSITKSSRSSRSSNSHESKVTTSRQKVEEDKKEAAVNIFSKRKEGSRHSSKSSQSRSSCSCRKSSIHSKDSLSSLESKARTAGLKAEAEFLEKTMEAEVKAEAKRKEEEIKSRLSKLKLQIAKSEASAKAVRDNIHLTPPSRKILRSVSPVHKSQPSGYSRHQSSTSRKPDKIDSPFQNSSELIKLMRAPTVDIDVFNGNPLEYEYFKSNFREVVESTIDDQRGRLMRLIKYTSDKPKDLIKHCIHEDHDCYDKAMHLLDKEYGNAEVISESYLRELRDWPSVKQSDTSGFKDLYWFLLKCNTYKRKGKLVELDSTSVLRSILSKLHHSYHGKWANNVERIKRNHTRAVNFDDLIEFIDFHSSCANSPSFSFDMMNEAKKGNFKSNSIKHKTSSTSKNDLKGDTTQSQESVPCIVCNSGPHELEECTTYISRSIQDRRQMLRDLKLCFSCFQPITRSHYSRVCNKKKTCNTCHEFHPTSLHDPKRKIKSAEEEPPQEQTKIYLSAVHHRTGQVISMCIVPVYVSHNSKPDDEILCYAMLDYNCTGCLALPNILESLAPDELKKAHVSIETVTGSTVDANATALDGLLVRRYSDEKHHPVIQMPTTFSSETIPASKEEIPTPDSIRRFQHLNRVVQELPDYMESIQISLIIGGNCPKANEPINVLLSEDNGPFAYETRLGWCVVGPIAITNTISKTSPIKCHRISVVGKEHISVENIISGNIDSRLHFSPITTVKDSFINNKLNEMYSHEFNEENSEDRSTSNEDDKFLQIMHDHGYKEGQNHVLPLPFRVSNPQLPNNRQQALARLQSIRRRMMKDSDYKKVYSEFVEMMISLGYARQCSLNKNVSEGKLWYLPHHGVFQPIKNKIRVVFDCSARYNDRCLNDELLQGPDLTNGLLGVLLRFRENPIAIMADIEKMFCQVRVPDNQRSYLRFLWWPDGNLMSRPVDHEMCVHTFGAASSPSCANFALRKTATEGEAQYGSDAAETLRKNFYVDDLLKSTTEVDEAISLLLRLRKMCGDGGFNLTKVVSNSSSVMAAIPVEHHAHSVSMYELSRTPLIERALGVIWCIENDNLSFRIGLQDTPLSRRGILSTISSVYDPLGMASPFLLKGRKILQEITSDQKGWDAAVSDEHKSLWEEWRQDLHLLCDLRVRRCYRSDKMNSPTNISLHGFPDASAIGYGSVFYLRFVDSVGRVEVSLVMAKSRVAPINKPVTLPRLELTAADLSAKLSRTIKRELDLPNSEDNFWSDSMVTLGYIHNETKRFRLFVANRVKRIRSISSKDNWKHITGKFNPGDGTSRGISLRDTDKVQKWFNGPSFLYHPRSTWPIKCIEPVSDKDPELKVHTVACCINIEENSEVNDLITHFEQRISSWSRIVRVLAIIQKFCSLCRKQVSSTPNKMLSLKDLYISEHTLLNLIQKQHFNKELKFYNDHRKGSKRVPNKIRRQEGRMWTLDPFVDIEGLLRIGGRLRKSSIDDTVRHPVILPKSSKLVTRLIEHHHKKVHHCGRTTTINAIRSFGYWIISCNSSVRRVIYNCVPCRRYRGQTGEQKMANLPLYRTSTYPPFTYCGVDIFGPFFVKERRKELKRFVALFTCMSCRAVHLEVVNDISTDSFILALRRFLCRRGGVTSIISDNGTNFVGAQSEFRKAFAEMDQQKINDFLLSKSCEWIEWKKNPPHASHMGGVWERQIRSVRNILMSLLKEHTCILNEESLRTLMVEAEAIVNSRPITTDNLCDPDIIPLSPNQLLTMKTNPVLPPPGNFQRPDLYCRKRWRQVQYLANEFWRRWRKEYVTSLQMRNKWTVPKRNVCVNDIVLLKEENVHRQQWPLGKVVKVFKDATDGLVRSVEIQSAHSKSALKRPIHKLVLLLEANNTDDTSSAAVE